MAYSETMHQTLSKVVEQINRVMIGKQDIAILSLVAILAKGHVLLEDVPGVGKTMMVRTLSQSIGAVFKRIQFTPDLLPSDITGVSIFNQKTREFEYIPGPIMGNIILAVELNRTSPKTQSALLEAMEEGSVTIDGLTRVLAPPFFVMATQNPIEQEGTYMLPEAQLDRFLFKLRMGYPTMQEELDILRSQNDDHPLHQVHSIISTDELIAFQKEVAQVHIDEVIKEYIVQMTQRTREHPSIYLGVSPRGSIALMKAVKSYAFIHGRDYCIPDDVQILAQPTLAHRITLKPEARFAGVEAEHVIAEILNSLHVPVNRSLRSL